MLTSNCNYSINKTKSYLILVLQRHRCELLNTRSPLFHQRRRRNLPTTKTRKENRTESSNESQICTDTTTNSFGQVTSYRFQAFVNKCYQCLIRIILLFLLKNLFFQSEQQQKTYFRLFVLLCLHQCSTNNRHFCAPSVLSKTNLRNEMSPVVCNLSKKFQYCFSSILNHLL